ncbi:MAG TPA: hypothetical protein VIG24_03755 [Acidimicrobiia bacterium]
MIATVLQVFGMLLLAVGAFMVAPAAGVLTLGVSVLAFGLAMERSQSAE